MKFAVQSLTLAAGMLVASAVFAQAPASVAPPKAAAPAGAPAAPVAAPKAAASKPAAAAPASAAAGGGADKVWVNAKSKTYHCFGTKYYGKTKAGEFMTEADAKAKGNHADHGKACKPA